MIIGKRVEVGANVLEHAETALRGAGRDGCERFVLWSGLQTGDTCRVLAGHVPAQTAYKTKTGLLVRVDGPALHEFNGWLFEQEQMLIAQLHAHPHDAYHSDTDDTYPIVTQLGGLSFVAADFCRHGLLSRSTATFRLHANGWIAEQTPIEQLLRVV